MASDQLDDLVVDLFQTPGLRRAATSPTSRTPAPGAGPPCPSARSRTRTLPCPDRCREPSRVEVRRRAGRSSRPRRPPYERTFAFTPGFAAHHSRRWPKTLARCSVSVSGRSGDQRTTTSTTSSLRSSPDTLLLHVRTQGVHEGRVADLDLHGRTDGYRHRNRRPGPPVRLRRLRESLRGCRSGVHRLHVVVLLERVHEAEKLRRWSRRRSRRSSSGAS